MSATVDQDETGATSVRYREAPRSYVTSLLLFALLLAGFGADLALGGGRSHLLAWGLAVVGVVGVDALSVHAARSLRSITVTDGEVRVGDEALARRLIVGVEREVDPDGPVLGRAAHEGLPRGVRGLTVHVADGAVRVIPTRHPDRLAKALEVALTVPGIRPAGPDEEAAVLEVHQRALSLFSAAGLELPPGGGNVDALHEAKAVLVAGRPPVGAVVVHELDGLAHIKQMSVLPGRMHQGIGSALLEAVCDWAAAHGYPAVTGIAYADLPWSAPYYAARGFVEVATLTPELAELRDWERSTGMDRVGRRVVMRRELPGSGSAAPA